MIRTKNKPTGREWHLATVAVGLALIASQAVAQISINAPDATYVQDFNDLSSSGTNDWDDNETLVGWYTNKLSYQTAYRSLAYPIVSYGVTGTNSASDRALGMSLLATPSDTAYLQARFVNNTGETLYSAEVSFYGEQYFSYYDNGYRFDGGMLVYSALNPTVFYPSEQWTQQNGMTFNPGPLLDPDLALYASNFFSAYGLDGNDANFRTLITGTINFAGGMAPGDQFVLMWGNTNSGVTGNGLNSDGLAIDDLNLTFRTTLSAVPEPSTFGLLAGFAMLGVVLGRRRGQRV